MNKKFAFVFPGQGSQKTGMLAEFYTDKMFIDTFSQASAALDYDLLNLAQNGPQEEMNLTELTQPLLLTSSVALWRIWQNRSDAAPSFMAGHSLGEWSALVCAEVLAFTDAVKLVHARGQYMQAAVPVGKGAMAAIIGLPDDQVEKICSDVTSAASVCAAVNYNSPGQLVIAGDKAAVELAIVACEKAGAKRALLLPVSAPFHTSLMRPAADQLAEKIEDTSFSRPKVPVVHNVNAQTESDPQSIKRIMVEQIYSPVRWVDCVSQLYAMGATQTVECGPGKVLSGLIKRIQRELEIFNTDSEVAFQKSLDARQ